MFHIVYRTPHPKWESPACWSVPNRYHTAYYCCSCRQDRSPWILSKPKSTHIIELSNSIKPEACWSAPKMFAHPHLIVEFMPSTNSSLHLIKLSNGLSGFRNHLNILIVLLCTKKFFNTCNNMSHKSVYCDHLKFYKYCFLVPVNLAVQVSYCSSLLSFRTMNFNIFHFQQYPWHTRLYESGHPVWVPG